MDDSDDEKNDGVDDDNYDPGKYYRRRRRPRMVTLEVDVNELRKDHSKISDRHRLSEAAQSDTLTNFVQKGGGDLSAVPGSPRHVLQPQNAARKAEPADRSNLRRSSTHNAE